MGVPSHVGISGNKTADKVANEAKLPHNYLKLDQTTIRIILTDCPYRE